MRLSSFAVPLSALLSLAFAPAAVAEQGVDYVALGDSYSSGVGTGNYYPESGDCLRGPQAYPVLWADSHDPSSFAFAACAGATTRDVIDAQLSALSTETDLVTVTIGGNDVGFVDVVTRCVLGSDAECDRAVTEAEARIINELPDALQDVYAAVVENAPDARVVVLGYPRLFETGDCGLLGLSEAKRARMNAAADLLAEVVSEQAARAGFDFVDARGPFAGHGVCAADPWINGTTFPLGESYHPNAEGHSRGYLPALSGVTSSEATASV